MSGPEGSGANGRPTHRGSGAGLGVGAILFWLLAMACSLVASPDYTWPVSLALVFAMLHFAAVAVLVRRGSSWLRFSWLLLSLPLAVYTLDNFGRLSYILGGPLFRVLI
jgi:hypothetical protein